MSGILMGWLSSALAGTILVLLLLIIAVLALPRTVRALVSRIHCPLTGRLVEVRMLALDRGDPVCVTSCSGLAEPRAVTCGMACIGGDHRVDLGGEERRLIGLGAD
jgi:hypothetical protein